MEKMTFTTDRTSLTEGEIIEITWDCHEAERVELTIDNGFKSTVLPLDLSGTKRFRLHRSRGKTHLTITAWVGGRSYSKTIKVKVAEMPTTHAETVDDKGRTVSRASQWLQDMGRRWQGLKPEKKIAVTVLAILVLILLFLAMMPLMLPIGIIGLIVYLVIVIARK